MGACSSWLKLPVLCIARAIDCDVFVRLIISSMPRIIECDVRARGAVILAEVSGFVLSDFGVEARVNAFGVEARVGDFGVDARDSMPDERSASSSASARTRVPTPMSPQS